jgi:hypothetical protein
VAASFRDESCLCAFSLRASSADVVELGRLRQIPVNTGWTVRQVQSVERAARALP